MWKRPKGKFSKEARLSGKLSRQEIVSRYVSGHSAARIAADDGTTKTSVLRVLARSGCARRRGKQQSAVAKAASSLGVSVSALLRAQAVMALGGVCAGCGTKDIRVLAVNHLHGKAHKLRLTEMHSIVRGNTDGFDVRCANCNVLYEHERGKFPKHAKLFEFVYKTLRSTT